VRARSIQLEQGEELRAQAHASFRGAAATSARATFALGSAKMRHRAFESWRDGADAAHFPIAGPEMVLVVTSDRLLVCKPSFWSGRAAEVAGAVPLEKIAEVVVVRAGLVTGCAIALTSGAFVQVEAVRGRRLRALARALDDARQQHKR
jgi:hypothetical protein